MVITIFLNGKLQTTTNQGYRIGILPCVLNLLRTALILNNMHPPQTPAKVFWEPDMNWLKCTMHFKAQTVIVLKTRKNASFLQGTLADESCHILVLANQVDSLVASRKFSQNYIGLRSRNQGGDIKRYADSPIPSFLQLCAFVLGAI